MSGEASKKEARSPSERLTPALTSQVGCINILIPYDDRHTAPHVFPALPMRLPRRRFHCERLTDLADFNEGVLASNGALVSEKRSM